MEFKVKGLENIDFETLIKLADEAIHQLERIAKALETIAEEEVYHNETL